MDHGVGELSGVRFNRILRSIPTKQRVTKAMGATTRPLPLASSVPIDIANRIDIEACSTGNAPELNNL